MEIYVHKKLLEFGDTFVTALLIVMALVIIGIALFNHNPFFKAAAAAWVLLP